MADQIFMADAKVFLYYIPMKSWTRGLLEVLITNLPYNFKNVENLRWMNQYSGRKILLYIIMKNKIKGL